MTPTAIKVILPACAAVAMAAVLPSSAWRAAGAETERPKPYPLQTCLVSGAKLAEMGKPYVFSYQGREIKLCCESCLKAFNKQPDKFIQKLEAAEKQAAAKKKAPGRHVH